MAGVDEAGRGALFGPVVAAAVILPDSLFKEEMAEWGKEINDCKLLSAATRERLAKIILTYAVSVGMGFANNHEIDQKNIYWASLTAMKRAVKNMSINPDFLLVDGFCLNGVNCRQIAIPQGDRKSLTIAAASVMAKVFRDEMICRLDKIYQGYALAKNKGYGTPEHYRALEKMGPTSLHRRSFKLQR